jgi:hypothetical protein
MVVMVIPNIFCGERKNIPLAHEDFPKNLARGTACAAFERRILQSIDCKMVSNVRANCEHRPDDAHRARDEVNRGAL